MTGAHPPTLKPDWTQRHRTWAIALPLLALAAFIALFAVGVLHLLKSSEPYRYALVLAQSSPTAQTVLGEPIEAGFYLTGSVKLGNDSGHADLSIPLHGSRAAGTLHILATKSGGVWHFDRVILSIEQNNRRFDLLPRSEKTTTLPPAAEFKFSVPLLP